MTWAWWLALGCGLVSSEEPADPGVPPGGADGSEKGADTLVVGAAFDPGNLNPLVLPYGSSFELSDLVNPGLVRRIDGFEPALAESWAWSDDGMALTYRLREGLVWEDGVPLTSADVAFTWSLIANPAVASNWHGSARHVARVEAPDPRTVRYVYAARRNPNLQQGVTVRGIVASHLLEGVDPGTLRGHASARRPLASGPFRVASWSPNESVVLEPNPRAPEGTAPHLERIVVRILPEYATRVIELERGTIDLLAHVDVQDVPRLQAIPRLRLVRTPAASMTYLGYDTTEPPFDDVRVRRAMTLAVDLDQLRERTLVAAGQHYGQSCVGTVSPGLAGWVPGDLEPLPHDPARASSLLTQAGYADGDGDGILERAGAPFAFIVMIQSGDPEAQNVAVWIQAQLRRIGVDMRGEKVEPTRFAERARARDFEAMIWGFGANPVVDPSIQWRSDGQYNWMGLSDPEIDARLDEGVRAGSVEAAQAAFHDVQRRVYEAQPATFLYWRDGIIAVDRRFQGTQHDTYSSLRHAERWWVPPAQRRYPAR